MSYASEREEFIATMTRHELPLSIARALLRAATTLNRLAELSCSSEAADRDRVLCPAATVDRKGRPRTPKGDCLCLGYGSYDADATIGGVSAPHGEIPRIAVQEARITARVEDAVPEGWTVRTQGDPRGCVLSVVPPSYAERNAGRDIHNIDSIGVPSGPSGIRW